MYLSKVSHSSTKQRTLILTPRQFVIGLFFIAIGLITACQSEPNDFMQALQDGDTSAAFAMLDEDLQNEFGGADGFGEWASIRQPISFSFGSKCSANLDSARADGSGRLANDDRFFITLHMHKVDDVWLIQGIEHSIPQTELWGRSSQLDCSD